MKALRLSTLAACLFLVISSCTKDSNTLSSSSTTSSQDAVLGAKAVGTGGGQTGGNSGGNVVGTSATNDKKPVLTPSQDKTEAYVNEPLTISFTATDPANGTPVSCGRITIYQYNATTEAWDEVGGGNAPLASYTFTPTTAEDCAYKFKAGYNPGGGGVQCKGDYAGVGYDTQTEFCADVRTHCVETFTVNGNATAVPAGDGLYEFTITYTLTSPKDITNIHFQGGATSGGQFEHVLTDMGDMKVLHNNNQNTVLYWEGPLNACTPVTLTFKYKRKFSCPATDAVVTGQWSASAAGMETYFVAPLTYSCQ